MGDFLLLIIELFSLGAFVLSQFTRLTDRETDRRTDGQMLIGKTALHTMQRGKNNPRLTISCISYPQLSFVSRRNRARYCAKQISPQTTFIFLAINQCDARTHHHSKDPLLDVPLVYIPVRMVTLFIGITKHMMASMRRHRPIKRTWFPLRVIVVTVAITTV